MSTAVGPDRRSVIRMYLEALLTWLLVGFGPAVVLAALLAVLVHQACGGATDCSWGLEYLLAVPVLLACLLWLAPWALAVLLAPQGSPDRSAVRRVAVFSGLGAIVLLYGATGNGIPAFLLMIPIVVLAPPALATWRARI